MYSLNVPVPAGVARQASDLAVDLPGARPRDRGEHTLVVKRLDGHEAHLVDRAREAIAGTDPFSVTVTGVDLFAEPTTGRGPVVYLVLESPPLVALHRRLCERFDPVPGLEGDDYVPHVTVARGGDHDAAHRFVDREPDPHSFDVEALVVRDAHRDLAAARFSLPR